MSKRVYELAKEMNLKPEDIQEACKGLKISLASEAHLTSLSTDDEKRVRSALGAGRGSKDARGNHSNDAANNAGVVRRRKANEPQQRQEAPAANASSAQNNTQVAGGAGSVATSPTTVRRKRSNEEEAEQARKSEPTDTRAVIVSRPRVQVPAKQPVRSETNRPAPVREERQEEAAKPSVQQAVAVEASAPKAERETVKPAPQQAPVVKPEAAPRAEATEGAKASSEPARSNTSLVQVVRRVDDAIMQNLINEAQRRAERQAGGGPGGGRGPGGPGGRGPGGPGGRGPGGPGGGRGPGGPGGGRGPGGPGAHAPANMAAGAPGPNTPPPGADNRGNGRGRVAWEKKDRGFDDRMNRMRQQQKRRPGGRGDYHDMTPRVAHRVIKIEDTVTVGELAAQLSVKASEIIKKLMLLGEMVTVNNVLDMDTVQLLAQEPEFNFDVENVAFDIENYIPKTEEVHAEAVPRDPVVTVMGHVDHGKTSLLDYIRKARVAAGEAGGITQHIGAYKVPVVVNGSKRHVVFLDTPGHAAFTAMRARGAQVTDVVILVVAADDGVMPQTVEAINHAKAANVPVIVAVTKSDKSDARPDKIRQQMTEYGLVSEDWGGDTQFVDVSSKTGMGIDDLLERVALQSDVLELRAVQQRPAKGVVIEAELSKGRGPVATVLVQEGTLNKGDIVVAGKAMGRVRAMVDDRGRQMASAGPASPVEVLGLDSVPAASERFYVVKDERDAKAIVSHLEEKERKGRLAEERKKVSLDDLFAQMQAGEVKTLNLVIKSDVQGSLEALRTAFSKLKHPELEVRIIHDAVGAISEHDVYLASASNAIIIGFNVRPEKNAKTLAEQYKVDIKLYSVIYSALEDVKSAMEGMLKPNIEEKFVGRAAVRNTFGVPKIGTVAGCAVLQGKLVRNQRVRLIRDGRVITDTKLDSLRRFKDLVNEVERGFECGAHLENYNDIKVGDELECYELIEIAQKLKLED